jgi:hypothetical protein
MVPVSGKITRKVKATEHTDRVPAWWAVRSLMARTDTLMEQTIARRVEGSLAARMRELEERAGRAQQIVQTRHAKLADALTRLLGDDFRYLDPDAIAVAAVEVLRDLDWAAKHAKNAHDELQAHRTTNAQEATR